MIKTILFSLFLSFVFIGCGSEEFSKDTKEEPTTHIPKKNAQDAKNIFTAGDDQNIAVGDEVVVQSSILDTNKTFSKIIWSENGKVLGNEEILHADNLSVGKHEILLTMEDTEGNVYTDTVTVTIKEEDETNNPPKAEDFTISVDEDDYIVTNLKGGDPDGDSITYLYHSLPKHGKLSGSTAHLTYRPKADYFGKDSFTFKTNDGKIDSRIATVSIVVNPINDIPIAHDDIARTDEDSNITFNVLINDIDLDKNHVSTLKEVSTNKGHVTFTDNGNITFSPIGLFDYLADNEEENVTLNYTMQDDYNATSIAKVALTVVGKDDNIIIDTISVQDINLSDANDTLIGQIKASDKDNNITFKVKDFVYGFEINTTGHYTYTPSATAFYKLHEGERETIKIPVLINDVEKNITISIIGENDAPTTEMTISSLKVMQGETITFEDASYDGDNNDTLTYKWYIDTVLTSEKKKFTHLFFNLGEHNITLKSQDKLALFDSISKTITITDGYPHMQLANIVKELHEDESIFSSSLQVEGGLKPFTFIPIQNIAGWNQKEDGSFSFSTKGSAYQALAKGTIKQIQIPLKVIGENNLSEEQNLTFTITGTNDTPIANDDTNHTNEDNNITFNVLTNDSDVDNNYTLTLKEVSASKGNITFTDDGNITFSPIGTFDYLSDNEEENITLNYVMQDEYNATATAKVTVTVHGVDDSLHISPISQQTIYLNGNNITGKIKALDLDNEVVFSEANSSDGLEINATTGAYTFTPPAGMFDYLSEGSQTDYRTSFFVNGIKKDINFTIIGKNDVPEGKTDTAIIKEDTPTLLDVLANDADNDKDQLTISYVSKPTNGSTTISNDNKIIYTPKEYFSGEDMFSYTPYDSHVAGNSTSVTIIVQSVNNKPIFSSIAPTVVKENEIYTYNIETFDPDSEENITITNKPDWLTFNSSTKILTGTAPSSSGGGMFGSSSPSSYDIALTVSDGYLSSDQNFTISITQADNIVPVFDTPIAIDTHEDNNSINGTLTATDSDNDSVSFSTDSNLTGFSLDTNGSFTLDVSSAFYQALSFDENITTKVLVIVTDTSGATDEQNLTIKIAGKNDNPTAVEFTLSTNEDENKSFNPLLETPSKINDIDHDANLTIIDVNTSKGEITVQNNIITFSPQGYFEYLKNDTAFEDIYFTIQDEYNATAVGKVTMKVSGLNDAPQVANFRSITIEENSPKSIDINATDKDGDNLIYSSESSLVDFEDNGSYTLLTDQAFEHLAEGQSETITIFLSVSDKTSTITQELNVTIKGKNDTPIANPDEYNITQNGSINMDVLANDSDDDNDTLKIASITANNFTVNKTTDEYLFFQTANTFDALHKEETQEITFFYTIKDEYNTTSKSTSVVVHVSGKDDAPIVEITGSTEKEEGKTLTFQAKTRTIDANTSIQSYTWSLDGNIQSSETNTLSLQPSQGVHSLELTIADNRGLKASHVVDLNITKKEVPFVKNQTLDTTTGENISWIKLADLDKDADADIIVNVSSSGDILWYENKGNNNYEKHTIASGVSSQTVQVADIDADGYLDILYAKGATEICFNNKNKTFNCERDLTNGFTRDVLYSGNTQDNDITFISVANIDNQGGVDIITTSWKDGNLELYKQNNSKFSTEPKKVDTDFAGAISSDVADIDGDGNIDIVAAAKNGVKYYINNGSGNFTIKDIANTENPTSVAIANLNNVGKLDIITTHTQKIRWSTVTFGAYIHGTVDDAIKNPPFALGADIDGDGYIDIVSNSYETAGQIVWYENNGKKIKPSFKKHIIASDVENITITQASDMDNDGDIDVVSADKNGKIHIYLNESPIKNTSIAPTSDGKFTRDDTAETITDLTTGLEWQDSEINIYTWENALSYCKQKGNGWRLPSVKALFTIADKSISNPSIDNIFQYKFAKNFWTSTSLSENDTKAWVIDFNLALDHISYEKTKDRHVRCVKGTPLKSIFIRDDNRKVVIDTLHKLMWEDSSSVTTGKQKWNNAKDECLNLKLASYTNWRLPNINELYTIVDRTKNNPATKDAFKNSISSAFWSSTEFETDTYRHIDFSDGNDGYKGVKKTNYTRCVRDME